MSRPATRTIPGGYQFSWEEACITTDVLHIHQHRDGRVTAELIFRTTLPGVPPHLHQTQLNLLASRSKSALAKDMHEKCPADWDTIIEQLCVLTIQSLRDGEPATIIRSSEQNIPQHYLIDPIVPQGMVTTIFGEPGSTKSYLALVLGIIAMLPWDDNPLALGVQDKTCSILYLDWETDEHELRKRLKCIQQGMELPEIELYYRRCALPLVDDITKIQQLVYEGGVKFVIVDSLGGACGGDLNEAGPVLAFFRALRSLDVSSLLVGHTSKGDMKSKSIYGSVFFTAYSRQIWECRKIQEPEEVSIETGLFHRKSNTSRLHKPIGVKWVFEDNRTSLERCSAKDISSLVGELSLREQIQDVLKSGPMSVTELCEELGEKQDVVRMTLNRNKSLFAKDSGKQWGLIYKS